MKLELEDMVEAYAANKNGIFVKVLEWNRETSKVLADVFDVEQDELTSIEFYFKEFESLTEARKKFNMIKKLDPDYTWSVLLKKGKITEVYSYSM